MTAKPLLAPLAALATAVLVIVWVRTTPAESTPPETPARPGPSAPSAPAAPASLPDAIVSAPQPRDAPPDLVAPDAEPGFTIAVSARQLLSTGKSAPPAVAKLELGVCTRRLEPGEPLMVFETEPDGTAQIAFPRRLLPESTDGQRQELWLRSEGVGLLTRIAYAQVPAADDVTVNMRLDVQSGAMVEGRILGPDGQPVAGRVDCWWFGEQGITRSRMGVAGPDGLFRGELRHEGRHGLLAAGTSSTSGERVSYYMPDQLELGTGFSAPFDVDFTQLVPFQELHVSGPGLIRGRVRDDSGAPAAGVRLVAVLAELDDEKGSLRLPYPRTHDLERLGGGHLWVTAATDSYGAFAFRGLRDGLFHVRAAGGDESASGYPILLTERAVPSLGAALELLLTRPYLAIHVREAGGSVPERAIEVHRDDRWNSTLDTWPKEPGLLVTLSPRDAHRGWSSGAYLEASLTGPGEFVADLGGKSGTASALELDVGVLGGELPWRPLRVAVPPGAGRVDVELVLPPAEVPGSLALDVVDAAGRALTMQIRIRVIDPATGVVLVDAPCDFTDEVDWPMRISLPQGEYRLLVEGDAYVERQHGTLARRRVHGAHEQSLHISPGVESRVTAILGQAARLAVRVIGSVTEADREAIRAWYDGDVSDEHLDYWAPFVSLRLEREGRWPETPLFARHAWEGTSASGTHLFSTVAFGGAETSEPLTPDTYTLVATTAGGRELEQQVTFVAGQTLSVTLRFE